MTARVGLPALRAVSVIETGNIHSIDSREWDALWEQCPDATVFQRREWLQTYARVFAPNALKIFVASEGGHVVGLAPLMRAGSSDRGQGADWLILGDDYSDYQSFLARRGDAAITEALLDCIDRSLPPGDSIGFFDVPQFSSLGLCLAARARRGEVTADAVTPCPTLQLRHNANGAARVLAKASLRRSERSLSMLGAVAVEHFESAAAIGERLPALFAQHESRWQGSSSPSLFRSETPREFYRQITAALAPTGGVQYTAVSLDGRVVAQHFGLRSRDTLIWYKPAFDVALREHSPGDVLLKALVQNAQDAGLAELDFSRGDETFKNRFASLVRYDRNFLWHRHCGKRTLAKLKEHARTIRDSVKPRTPAELPALGGAACAKRRDLVLLVNADPSTIDAWESVSRSEDVRVQAVADSELDAIDDATLVVPCDEASAEWLSQLSLDHPARRGALLQQSSARTAPGGSSGAEARLVCVCAGGSVIQYFTTEQGASAADWVQLAQAELGRRGWHGAATVEFGANADGQLTISSVLPLLRDVDDAVRSGVDLPLTLWRLASGVGTPPQPV
ncbi:CelD/BcsL family acetyltransferase involved in cellulose biosynthesis [Povalibacter uvarum]|uniref:CelD/BcsL family acetyltransferase involved in cellulose biosynthesis n=1 Tax=Povalibacter uvarum TaxID=732238 RepID=A0A841HG33_9GAMM|nr:GNAT family N-acetyltransferase [Povalibacter uvarum]MBB6091643.1 CelD/BcsL family acetyltransferase involved in cellulose biosynthesis [Povalibacter uvarum]